MAAIAACLYVRNAETDIQEWIAYHRSIGIKAFLIYDNGSTDSTVAKAEAMAPIAVIRLVPWGHSTGVGAQGEAYSDCIERFRKEFEWIIFLDSDEFLVSVDGQQVESLLTGHFFHSAIAFNWVCFGSSGHVEIPTGLTTENFTRRSDDAFDPNRQTKVMVRPDLVRRYVNPHYFEMDGQFVRPDGSAVDWDKDGITKIVDISKWRIHHYFVRSQAHWAAKLARGYRDVTREADLFSIYDRNEILDMTVANRSASVHALIKQAAYQSRGKEKTSAIRSWLRRALRQMRLD